MKFKDKNLKALAECIIGDNKAFLYRSSSHITEFFGTAAWMLLMTDPLGGNGRPRGLKNFFMSHSQSHILCRKGLFMCSEL